MRETANDGAAHDLRTPAELFPGEVLVVVRGSNPPLPGIPQTGPVPLPDHTVTDADRRVAGGVGVWLRRPILEWMGLIEEADHPGQVHYEWRGDVLAVWDDPHAADGQPRFVRPAADGRYLVQDHWMVLSDDAAQRHLDRHRDALTNLAGIEHPSIDPVLLDYLSRPADSRSPETDEEIGRRRDALIEAVQRFDPGVERGREYDRITAARTAADEAVAHHARRCVQAAARAVLRFHPDAWSVVVDLHDHDRSSDANVVLAGVRDYHHNDLSFSDDPQWHHAATDVERWLTEALAFLAPERLGWCTDLRARSLHMAKVNLRPAPEPCRAPHPPAEHEPVGHAVVVEVDASEHGTEGRPDYFPCCSGTATHHDARANGN
ncbi:hypothetical protein ALI22I_20350 [Saccharothrix sp. ALI-22-I]|uniref:hypothetical protein n=1 Tax=Saccharothrix sp. ALI-22-I TaxID=1933778 RepID=UPI00097BA87E|nr:hypothetical protein [Saccharothrix sp. ALI-22-I]ONI88092.1 hypothetical protein ALI22I_20350 [Saccharothrix sp. ALI-22-I]